MANQYIDKKYAGTESSPTELTDSAANRAIRQNRPPAAGLCYDVASGFLKYNGADAIKTVVDASSAQTLTSKTLTTPTLAVNVLAATAVGTNQTTALAVTTASVAVLTVTGATDTGIKLPAATAGAIYIAKKLTTDTISVYATGAETINGTTDAMAIAAIGTLIFCVTAGEWRALNVAS